MGRSGCSGEFTSPSGLRLRRIYFATWFVVVAWLAQTSFFDVCDFPQGRVCAPGRFARPQTPQIGGLRQPADINERCLRHPRRVAVRLAVFHTLQ